MDRTESGRPAGRERPTSRDVARLAGVSHTAVSFVFNGRAGSSLSSAFLTPPLSTVALPHRAMGESAARLLLDAVDAGTPPGIDVHRL